MNDLFNYHVISWNKIISIHFKVNRFVDHYPTKNVVPKCFYFFPYQIRFPLRFVSPHGIVFHFQRSEKTKGKRRKPK